MPKPELIYIGDPMCSWCWGFSKIISSLIETYQPSIEFRILLGGLRPTDSDIVDEKMKKYILDHWREVQKQSGQVFDFNTLNETGWIYNTEPACRAVMSARTIVGDIGAIHFFNHLQKAFYQNSNIITEDEILIAEAKAFGLDEKSFIKNFTSDSTRKNIFTEFQLVQNIGVHGFPTLLLVNNNTLILTVTGYSSYENISKRITNFLNKTTQNNN